MATDPVFWLGIAAGLFLTGAALWSIRFPKYRLWPPLRRSLATEIGIWPVTAMVIWSALAAGLADWNGLGWPAWLRWGPGLALLLGGNVLVTIGMWQLGPANTTGIPAGLVTRGLYRRSRNPQYLGQIVSLLGWFLLCASVWALPATLLGCVVFLLGAVAEDGWLEQQYGREFREWCDKTPMFLSL